EHINSNIPVYALTGPEISQKPFTTLRAAAARFIRMIREVQPQGPYRLAGWSLGGMLAYEVATQLIGMDQAVEFLGMIDTFLRNDGPNERLLLTGQRLSDIDWLTNMVSAGELQVKIKAQRILAELPSDANFADKINAFRSNSLLPRHLSAKYIQMW